MALSNWDIQFLQDLKSQGVSKDEAVQRLVSARQQLWIKPLTEPTDVPWIVQQKVWQWDIAWALWTSAYNAAWLDKVTKAWQTIYELIKNVWQWLNRFFDPTGWVTSVPTTVPATWPWATLTQKPEQINLPQPTKQLTPNQTNIEQWLWAVQAWTSAAFTIPTAISQLVSPALTQKAWEAISWIWNYFTWWKVKDFIINQWWTPEQAQEAEQQAQNLVWMLVTAWALKWVGSIIPKEWTVFQEAANKESAFNKLKIEKDKLTNEILQTPIPELRKSWIQWTPRAVEEAWKVITQSKDFIKIDKDLETKQQEVIWKVQEAINKEPNKQVSIETLLRPLAEEIDRLRQDSTKTDIADKMQWLFDKYLWDLKKQWEITWKYIQDKKMQSNIDLGKYFQKDTQNMTDFEQAEMQARDLIREWQMNAIEQAYWSEIWQWNKTYAWLSDARNFINSVNARFARAITPWMLETILWRIPFLKSIIWLATKWAIDQQLVPRSTTLLEKLPEKTKQIEKLRAQQEALWVTPFKKWKNLQPLPNQVQSFKQKEVNPLKEDIIKRSQTTSQEVPTFNPWKVETPKPNVVNFDKKGNVVKPESTATQIKNLKLKRNNIITWNKLEWLKQDIQTSKQETKQWTTPKEDIKNYTWPISWTKWPETKLPTLKQKTSQVTEKPNTPTKSFINSLEKNLLEKTNWKWPEEFIKEQQQFLEDIKSWKEKINPKIPENAIKDVQNKLDRINRLKQELSTAHKKVIKSKK